MQFSKFEGEVFRYYENIFDMSFCERKNELPLKNIKSIEVETSSFAIIEKLKILLGMAK